MKHGTRRVLVPLAALFLHLGTLGAAPLSKEDRAAIEATSRAFEKAFVAADAVSMASLYTKDAILLPPDAPIVEGAEAIGALMKTFPPTTSMKLENVEVEGTGEGTAWVRGTFVWTTAAVGETPGITIRGKYIEIRKRQSDGRWLFHRDMFSMDMPLLGGMEETK